MVTVETAHPVCRGGVKRPRRDFLTYERNKFAITKSWNLHGISTTCSVTCLNTLVRLKVPSGHKACNLYCFFPTTCRTYCTCRVLRRIGMRHSLLGRWGTACDIRPRCLWRWSYRPCWCGKGARTGWCSSWRCRSRCRHRRGRACTSRQRWGRTRTRSPWAADRLEPQPMSPAWI